MTRHSMSPAGRAAARVHHAAPAAICAAVVAIAASVASAAAPDAAPSRDFDLTYGASVSGLAPGAQRMEIWLPYLVSDAHQEVTVAAVSAPVPYEVVTEPRFGNSILHLVASGAAAERGLTVEMRVHVRRREYARHDLVAGSIAALLAPAPSLPVAVAGADAPPTGGISAAVEPWLEPDRLVPLDARVRELAVEVTRGRQGEVAKARAIYDYVVATMAYDKSGTGWGNGDIHWACDAKRGNCTDFHALFIGLARAAGIPAKFEIGLPLPAARGMGEIPGYHCWAEFYLARRGWVPVDASEARKHPSQRDYFFGALDENRVQLSIGRDLVLSPKQAGPPLNYFVYPYVEVDGQPFAKVERRFIYRDADPAAAPQEAGAGGGSRR